jgi:hypothetical protein
VIQVAASAAMFNTVVPSNTTFNPGSAISFTLNTFSPPGELDIVLIGGNTIRLLTGRYLFNYAVSIFNANQVLKMALFQDGTFVIPSFSSGPVAGGNAHTSGNALIIVTAATSSVQLRVDVLGGPVTPFSNATVVVTKLIETVV